jgi:hypothetical protein
MYAVFGTIAIAVWVLIYNLLASIVGGIELTLEPTERPATYAAAPAERQGGPEMPRPAGPEGTAPPGQKTINGF